jgi:hypothetical protein
MGEIAKEQFYGLDVGDEVFINGRGIGHIIEIVRGDFPMDDKVRFEIRRRCRCNCGHKHEAVEREYIHPMHVGLTVAARKAKQ